MRNASCLALGLVLTFLVPVFTPPALAGSKTDEVYVLTKKKRKPNPPQVRPTFRLTNQAAHPITYEIHSPKLGRKVYTLQPGSGRTFYIDLIGAKSKFFVDPRSNPAYRHSYLSQNGFDGQHDFMFYENGRHPDGTPRLSFYPLPKS